MGGNALADTVRQLARDVAGPRDVRAQALTALGRMGTAEDQQWLGELALNEATSELRGVAITSLAHKNLAAAAQAAVQWMADAKIDADPEPIMVGILSRPGGAAALTTALAGQSIREDAARRAIQGLEGTGRQEPDLAAALISAGRVDQPRKAWTVEQHQAFLQQVLAEGDPQRRRNTLPKGRTELL